MSLKINGEEPKNIYLGNDIYDYDLYVRYVKVNGKYVWTRKLELQEVTSSYISQKNVVIYDDGANEFVDPGTLIELDEFTEIYTALEVSDKHHYFLLFNSTDSLCNNNEHSLYTCSKNAYGDYVGIYYQEPMLQTYVEKTSGYSHCVPTSLDHELSLCKYGSLTTPSISGNYSMNGDTQKYYNINFYNPAIVSVNCTAKIYSRFSATDSWHPKTKLTFSIDAKSTVNKTGYYGYATAATQLKIVATISDPEGHYYDSNSTEVILGSLDDVMESSTTS